LFDGRSGFFECVNIFEQENARNAFFSLLERRTYPSLRLRIRLANQLIRVLLDDMNLHSQPFNQQSVVEQEGNDVQYRHDGALRTPKWFAMDLINVVFPEPDLPATTALKVSPSSDAMG
jgi:hypothetical protein